MRTATTAIVLLTAALPIFAQSADDSCGNDAFEGLAASLAWVEVPTAATEIQSGDLSLLLTNDSGHPIEAVVRVAVDNGSGRRLIRRVGRAVVSGASQSFSFRIPTNQLPDGPMPFAGRLTAWAEVLPPGACAARACRPGEQNRRAPSRTPGDFVKTATVYAAPVYFHRDGSGQPLNVYGEEILQSRYGGGALAVPPPALPDSRIVRARAAQGGRAHSGRFDAELAIASIDGGAPAPLGNIAAGPTSVGLCIKWEIGLTDAGATVVTGNGTKIVEDYWNGLGSLKGNNVLQAAGVKPATGNMTVTAHGVRVRFDQGAVSQEYDTNPLTGCIALVPAPGPFTLTVYGEHRDARGNRILYRPFGQRQAWVVELDPPRGKTRAISVGDFSAESTVSAVTGFAMYRTSAGVENRTILMTDSATCTTPGGNESSAHFDFSQLPAVALLRIHNASIPGCDPNDHRRRKFTISHEMGHAWMLLRSAIAEPNADANFTSPDESVCGSGASYGIGSVEYSSIGAREGTAHAYAAMVWNDPNEKDGVFTWFGQTFDVEANAPDLDGGRLFNNCTTSNLCGVTTNLDWLRFWWDWVTPYVPGDKPTLNTVAKVYERAIKSGPITREGYYSRFRSVMLTEVTDPAWQSSWDAEAITNGVDTSPGSAACM